MSLPATWINGEQPGVADPGDRGLLYGHGVFETMRYHHGAIHLQQWHAERLLRGCEVLGLPVDAAKVSSQLECVRECADRAAEADAVCRLAVTGGVAARGYGAASENPTWMISLSPVTLGWRQTAPAARLMICRSQALVQPQLAGLKHANRLAEVLAAREVAAAGCDEGLLLDFTGAVVSASSANIFAVRNGSLETPALSRAGIAGVVRRLVIERLGPRLGCPVRECELSPEALLSADELFLCNSLQGIRQVSQLVDRHFEAGPVTRGLQEAFFAAVEDECVTAA
jgi:4-amino-4-deoxychorismate lyase